LSVQTSGPPSGLLWISELEDIGSSTLRGGFRFRGQDVRQRNLGFGSPLETAWMTHPLDEYSGCESVRFLPSFRSPDGCCVGAVPGSGWSGRLLCWVGDPGHVFVGSFRSHEFFFFLFEWKEFLFDSWLVLTFLSTVRRLAWTILQWEGESAACSWVFLL